MSGSAGRILTLDSRLAPSVIPDVFNRESIFALASPRRHSRRF